MARKAAPKSLGFPGLTETLDIFPFPPPGALRRPSNVSLGLAAPHGLALPSGMLLALPRTAGVSVPENPGAAAPGWLCKSGPLLNDPPPPLGADDEPLLKRPRASLDVLLKMFSLDLGANDHRIRALALRISH